MKGGEKPVNLKKIQIPIKKKGMEIFIVNFFIN